MTDDSMLFSSALSAKPDAPAAAREALSQVAGQLSGKADAAFLFVSSLYECDWQPLLREIRSALGDPLLLGCTGGGILGRDRELEFTPALSLAAARLPRVQLHPFSLTPQELEADPGPGFWIEKLGATPAHEPIGILLPEPYSCDVMSLVAALDKAYPKMPLIGGLASGADESATNALFLNDQIIAEGAVGVLLTGDVALQTIVAQGCRPIGRPFIVTKADGNVILELAGKPATEALQQLFQSLPQKDQALARRALFLGIVMNEQKEKFARGDFLVRNLVGIDPGSGALAVGDHVQVGQTVQFQVRDAETSKEDLHHLLEEKGEALRAAPPAGGLLFSCMGRGRDLYGKPDYDIREIQSFLGGVPIAGFFCNGEIGPVGGRNYIHGFTSSLGLFRPR